MSKSKKYPTVKEAVKAIVGEFTPEQLKDWEIINEYGMKVSLEKQLLDKFGTLYSTFTIEEIKKYAREIVEKYKKQKIQDQLMLIVKELMETPLIPETEEKRNNLV